MALEASVATSFTDLLGLATSMLTFIEGNSLLMICFAGCLIKLATKGIKGARKAVGA